MRKALVVFAFLATLLTAANVTVAPTQIFPTCGDCQFN
jgi:hypothetical protein